MIKVLIYNGAEAAQNSPVNTGNILKNLGYQVNYTRKISAEILKATDVLVIPGGNGGRAYLNHFSDAEEKAIKDFVYNGGFYYGICAGQYLASKEVYQKKGDANPWYRGIGVAPNVKSYAVNYEGQLSIKLKGGKQVTVLHWNGGAMQGGEVLATYADNKTGFQGYAAIIGDTYGQGRVVLCASHPESAPQHPEVIQQIMTYLLKKTDGSGTITETENNWDKKIGYQILKEDFNQMIKAVEAFIKANNRNPNSVYIRKLGKKQAAYVTWAKYKEMKTRWDSFRSANKREPNWITIAKAPAPTPIPESKVGNIQKAIQDATGIKFNSITEFYNRIVLPYGTYTEPIQFDDKKTLRQVIKVLGNNVKGINKGWDNQFNCVDIAQLIAALAKEMGYTATLWSFRCVSMEINHLVVLVAGKEFAGKSIELRETQYGAIKTFPGVIVDGAAAALNSYKLGDYWCSPTHAKAHKEPGWGKYEKW